MATYSFKAARQCVLETVRRHVAPPAVEEVDLLEAAGRVLAEDILADRDYPPAARSIRDGYAVRAADVPGELTVLGEVRAGESFPGAVGPGQAMEIMTGAALPPGADAIVMVEFTTRNGDRMTTNHQAAPGEFVNPQGSEARKSDVVIPQGRRLGFADIAMIATVGRPRVQVYLPPRVAILATGDELVEIEEEPASSQVRNSNSRSLAVQVRRAGGLPHILPVARDNLESTRERIAEGLLYDLLLLSGGVSAGKYDLVETVLAEFGAEFYFDRVLIQPGQPLVFGRARGKFFFGLPGNPASTMVTFELFARAALDLLGGASDSILPLLQTRLAREFRHKPGLTRFLPAWLSADGAELTPVPWQGSSDVPALARANAFLVAEADRESWQAGDLIRVLVK